MKLAIYTQQLEYMGGIERVVIEHLRIFSQHGVELLLLVDRCPQKMKDAIGCSYVVLPNEHDARHTLLGQTLASWSPDYLILHGESHPTFADDMDVINQLGVKSICVTHFPFVTNILLDGTRDTWKEFRKHVSRCSAVATVGKVDAIFWRALGVRAFHVQNPFVHPRGATSPCKSNKDDLVNIIWVGRHVEQKQPAAMLAAFKLVEKECPNVHLYMIGGDENYCRGNVEVISERTDLNEYWAKAHIHVLTSICESFCLVWAEAKSMGIPTVMYDLPYLELSNDKNSYIAVSQRDVRALADAIIELVKDPEKRFLMGCAAKASIDSFNDEAVFSSWMALFDSLAKPKDADSDYPVDPMLQTIVGQLVAAYSYHFEKHNWESQMTYNLIRLSGGYVNMRCFARLVERIVECARRLKRMVH